MQNFNVNTDGGLEGIYEYGKRNPQALSEGKITIEGELEKVFNTDALCGGSTFSAVCGVNNSGGESTLSYMQIAYYPNRYTSGQPRILLTEVKFKGWELSPSMDGPALEKAGFSAKVSAVDTVP